MNSNTDIGKKGGILDCCSPQTSNRGAINFDKEEKEGVIKNYVTNCKPYQKKSENSIPNFLKKFPILEVTEDLILVKSMNFTKVSIPLQFALLSVLNILRIILRYGKHCTAYITGNDR